MNSDDTQRADHFEHLFWSAASGRCGHSGLGLVECKRSICDCFDFEWLIQPNTSHQPGSTYMTSTPTTPATGDRSPGRYWLDVALDTQDPHSMTGAAVTGLLAILVDHEEREGRAEASTAAYDELDAEYRELEAEAGRRAQVIDDIIAAVKPSTSKLADKVRAIVDESIVAHAGTPATEPVPDPEEISPTG